MAATGSMAATASMRAGGQQPLAIPAAPKSRKEAVLFPLLDLGVTMLVLAIAAGLVAFNVPLNAGRFPLGAGEDISKYSVPYLGSSTVPFYYVYALSLVLWLICLADALVAKSAGTPRTLVIASVTGTWALTHGLQLIIVNLLKRVIGRPRPDFLARCYGASALANTTLADLKSALEDLSAHCSTGMSTAELKDGKMSFISGHAAFAVATAWLVMWHVRARDMGRRVRYPGSRPLLWPYLLAILLLVASVYVSVSRFFDNKHHWDDILLGGILGAASATFFSPALI